MTRDEMERRLNRLLAATADAEGLRPGAWWVGDVAGERRALDDLKAGRLTWLSCHSTAQMGVKALAEGNNELAELCVLTAMDYYIAALEVRVRPSDRGVLAKASKRRGRPKKIKD